MRATVCQAGCRMLIESDAPIVDRVITEAFGSELHPPADRDEPDVHLCVPGGQAPFDVAGWEPVTRHTFRQRGTVVMINAGGSGFDLLIRLSGRREHRKLHIEARYRPPRAERAAGMLLRGRFHLLTREVLLQYPALWVASTRGRHPLHAAAVCLDGAVPLLGGPGGIGRSSLLLAALRGEATACSDNLCVSDGQVVHGVVEPVRVAGSHAGRRMPHGRVEQPLPRRVASLTPDRLIIIRRVPGAAPSYRPAPATHAEQVLTAGTYMAGELRRYWAFAATLALSTGHGPIHPPVAAVARKLAQLPCREITLGDLPVPSLAELLRTDQAVPA